MTKDDDVRPWPGMTTDPRLCPTCGEKTEMRAEVSGLCFYLCPKGHRHTLPEVLNPVPAPRPDNDPVLAMLETAPPDDAPLTADDARRMAEGLAAYQRGETVPRPGAGEEG